MNAFSVVLDLEQTLTKKPPKHSLLWQTLTNRRLTWRSGFKRQGLVVILDNLEPSIISSIGCWKLEGSGVAREKPRKYREDMLTPHTTPAGVADNS